MSDATRPQSAPTLPEIHVTHREQVREHYDRIASELDRFRQRHAYYHREIDRYYQFLVLPGSSVLEIGCGTGMLLFQIAPHCRRYDGWDSSAWGSPWPPTGH